MVTISVKHLKNIRLIGGTGADLIIEYDEKMTVGELVEKLKKVLPNNASEIKMLRFHPALLRSYDSVYPFWHKNTTLAECAIRYKSSSDGFWMAYITV